MFDETGQPVQTVSTGEHGSGRTTGNAVERTGRDTAQKRSTDQQGNSGRKSNGKKLIEEEGFKPGVRRHAGDYVMRTAALLLTADEFLLRRLRPHTAVARLDARESDGGVRPTAALAIWHAVMDIGRAAAAGDAQAQQRSVRHDGGRGGYCHRAHRICL